MNNLIKKLRRSSHAKPSNLTYLQFQANYSNASTINVVTTSDLDKFAPGLKQAVTYCGIALNVVSSALTSQGDFYTRHSPSWSLEDQDEQVYKLVLLAYFRVALERFVNEGQSIGNMLAGNDDRIMLDCISKFIDLMRRKELVEAFLCLLAAQEPNSDLYILMKEGIQAPLILRYSSDESHAGRPAEAGVDVAEETTETIKKLLKGVDTLAKDKKWRQQIDAKGDKRRRALSDLVDLAW